MGTGDPGKKEKEKEKEKEKGKDKEPSNFHMDPHRPHGVRAPVVATARW